jgi:hypothetical protein
LLAGRGSGTLRSKNLSHSLFVFPFYRLDSCEILANNKQCYDIILFMNRHLTSIDVSKTPDVLDLVEEVEATKKPRELRRDNKPVALLTPISENKEKWKKIKVSFGSWSDLDADELIATIYRWREEGSRPGTSECITHEYLN